MKKKLLISWGSPYQFNGLIVPLIPRLAKDYSVYVILVDYRMPASLRARLEAMTRQRQIENYWLLPDFSESFHFRDLLRHHQHIRRNLRAWRELDFDILLASDDLSTYQRYLSECVISGQCLHLCWIAGRTHLLIEWKKEKEEIGFLKKGLSKIGKAESPAAVVRKGVEVFRRSLHRFKKRGAGFLDRILLPAVLAGKTFPTGPHDDRTQTGPGDCNAVIFCDEATAKAHVPFCKTRSIVLASYPTEGLCRCVGVRKDNEALLILVGHGYEIGENFLDLYCRDIRAMLKATGARQVHLRPHPRSPEEAPLGLVRYLRGRGIDASPVGCDRPIWEIVCDYRGVAGPLSEALRDARATCDWAPVVCFASVSDPRYPEPRFSFGDHKMIDWIEKNGSYNPAIFSRRKVERPLRKTVPDILKELLRSK